MRDRPVTENRWLTSADKEVVLAAWDEVKLQPVPEGDFGCVGYPDPDIIPWCDRLNAIPGVCTLQSCAGHVNPGGLRDAGHLWLWLDRPMAEAFDSHAHRLARHVDYIEDVARRYTSWGQEVTVITFAGNECDRLPPSLRLILAFLRRLDQAHKGSTA